MIENLKTVKLNIEGKQRKVNLGLSLMDLAKDYQENFKYPIILAKVGNEYHELTDKIDSDKDISFVDLKERRGNQVHINGLIMLLSYSAKELFGEDAQITVKYSIDKGIYIETNFDLTEKKCKNLKDKMDENVAKELNIIKCRVDRREAIDYFSAKKELSKVELLKYNVSSTVTLYKLGDMYDYFFSLMPNNTSVLKDFDLHFLNNRGIVLLFPTVYIDGIKPYEHHPKVFEVFKEYQSWAEIMKIDNIPGLNKIVEQGRADDIIRIDETLQSNRLLNIARTIVERKGVKIILIAGPSSSGKTTTCRKLSMYLRSFGLEPREISMDDYFFDREKSPRDENGEYDFECLEAINTKQFEVDVKKLLNGEKVTLPRYNFITGKSEKTNDEIELGKNEVLIVEGIHALNEKVLPNIDRNKKFKIYLSPLTILNIDIHNRISLTDSRLLRRIVRDNRTRGYKVDDTLKTWRKVRLGEEKHIFPNQDAADVVFNTALIYELGVLKTYVEPLLYSVSIDSPYYAEAVRLINMLNTFQPIPSDAVPEDSLLREFIGGSCYNS
jgi:uridine kinase